MQRTRSMRGVRKVKLMSGRKTGYSPLKMENNRCVTNDIMFAYVHEKMNNLHSVLSIFLSF